jgi:hypothetical protein
MASDAEWFGEQIISARDSRNISNYTDGLQLWNPTAVIYFSDGDLTGLTLEGTTFVPPKSALPSQPSYGQLAAEEGSAHLTQNETGQVSAAALRSKQFDRFESPIRFFWGKSSSIGAVAALFGEVANFKTTVTRSEAAHNPGPEFQFGGPWQFYSKFWAAHGLSDFSAHVPFVLDIPAGTDAFVPLILFNRTGFPRTFSVAITDSPAWMTAPHTEACQIPPESACAVTFRLPTPTLKGDFTLKFEAISEGLSVGSLSLQLRLDSGILPQ